MKLSLFDQLEELLLVSIPTAEWGETTQQDVEDDAQSPHVHFNAITCRNEPAGQSCGCNVVHMPARFVFFSNPQRQNQPTRLTEDLRGHVRGRAAYSEDRFGHDHREAKVSQLQPTDAGCFALYLR